MSGNKKKKKIELKFVGKEVGTPSVPIPSKEQMGGGEKMKGKLLTICIVSILLGLALIPTTTGDSLSNLVTRDNEKAITQVFEKYADDMEEIQEYIETHFDPEHPELLILPDDLQEKVDTIVSELKGYYPLCGNETLLGGPGDINLPVSGTDDDPWIETWDNPVYMGAFHYTTSYPSDVHLKYKNSNGNWIEFDTNYWKQQGSYTDTIYANTYGIELGGWCWPWRDCTYTWNWYTDVNGNKCYTVPTGGGGDPTACFEWSPESPDVGETVTFDASCSEPNGGSINNYAWDLDENVNQGDDKWGKIVTWTYPSAGTYTVKLWVHDTEGNTDIVRHDVIVRGGGGDDGVTKIDFRWEWYGFQAWLYMNHDYIENNLEPALGLGVLGVALLLVALGFATMGIAWIFATYLVFVGLDAIQDCDQGRGIVVYTRSSWCPWWVPPIPPIMGAQ